MNVQIVVLECQKCNECLSNVHKMQNNFGFPSGFASLSLSFLKHIALVLICERGEEMVSGLLDPFRWLELGLNTS